MATSPAGLVKQLRNKRKMQTNTSENNSPLIKFFSRPIVGILGSIASIVGIVLSIYFFIESKESPQLTYLIHPAKAAVVRTGQTSQLTVQFNGKDLTGDVTAAQVAIWNEGRRPIRNGDVLHPLVIRTVDGQRILEASIQRVTRDVVKLALNTSRIDHGEVSVKWDILEQNDGGVIQIVHSGNDAVEIEAEVIVEGQPEIVRRSFVKFESSEAEIIKRQISTNRFFAYFILATGLFQILLFIYSNKIRLSIFTRKVKIAFILWIITTIAYATWILIFQTSLGPPFDF
jgi:hypothetical protein